VEESAGEPLALAFGQRAERRGQVDVALADGVHVQCAQSGAPDPGRPQEHLPGHLALELLGRVLEDLA
jgi:hypothetical protein